MYYKGTNFRKYSREKKYMMKDTSLSHLSKNYFRYRSNLSAVNESIYEHSFPVYKYYAAVTLEARFLVCQETGRVDIDVFDMCNKGIYGPWYNDESGCHKEIIDLINANIAKEMKKVGIYENKRSGRE